MASLTDDVKILNQQTFVATESYYGDGITRYDATQSFSTVLGEVEEGFESTGITFHGKYGEEQNVTTGAQLSGALVAAVLDRDVNSALQGGSEDESKRWTILPPTRERITEQRLVHSQGSADDPSNWTMETVTTITMTQTLIELQG